MNFDSMVASLIGMFALANDDQINTVVDNAADKVLSAVSDTKTQVDNVAARVLAEKLERFSARIRAGLTTTA